MSAAPDTFVFGPERAQLLVHTGRQGAAAKAGHDLTIVVERWSATLKLGESPSVRLIADGSSLRVQQGTGGVQALDDADKENVNRTIQDEVLKSTAIEFRSTEVERIGERMAVSGELELMGQTRPLTFDLRLQADGVLDGRAVVRQSEWGMKPYSALFGALKVADKVEVTVQASLQSPSTA